MNRFFYAVISFVCLPVFLFGCSQGIIAPIHDKSSPSYSSIPLKYDVRSGDTLYGIAFRYGFDYRELARANEIEAPYIIFPGQALSFNRVRPAFADVALTSDISKQPNALEEENEKNHETDTSKTISFVKKSPVKVESSGESSEKIDNWIWPTEGELLRNFSASLHKGIDISGEKGDSVVAAAAGRVVYAGSGISGFGKLLIVKHNENYLSAYGHNDRLLVEEDALVSAGEEISKKGSTGTDKVKLHFEIRREGKPVDPLKFLPSR